ncbi:hypothetical protein JZ751_002159 [Albula glossodonta]|uniref:Uncharacterized protein n=1 Tax=Albula glossodonta TaxID=121402 RepID=A0A8T2P778_9TELE|nr:hypothetical protein JZ751_002159 [Albula glossodonta]
MEVDYPAVSVQSQPGCPSSGSDDTPIQKASLPPSEATRAPSTPATTRRSLLPPPRGSPVALLTSVLGWIREISRHTEISPLNVWKQQLLTAASVSMPGARELQKDTDLSRPASSSPKRFVAVSPKPQSPVHVRQKPAVVAGIRGGSPRRDGSSDSERLLVLRLREQCEEQAQQLEGLQAELRKATLGLEVFAITTQHFCYKTPWVSVGRNADSSDNCALFAVLC